MSVGTENTVSDSGEEFVGAPPVTIIKGGKASSAVKSNDEKHVDKNAVNASRPNQIEAEKFAESSESIDNDGLVDANTESSVSKKVIDVSYQDDSRDKAAVQNLQNRYGYRFAKRALDIAFSAFALALIVIPCLIIAIVIQVESKGSPIYIDKRVGKGGKPLNVLKFRTMVTDSENFEKYFTVEQVEQWHKEHKVENDPRITKIGKFLRETSLDELPQFINVFLGQMSVVGPRPITEEELQWFTSEEREKLLSVRPGITGLWQVSSRNNATFESGERQQLELYYVNHIGFKMDVATFFRTFKAMSDKTGR